MLVFLTDVDTLKARTDCLSDWLQLLDEYIESDDEDATEDILKDIESNLSAMHAIVQALRKSHD